MEVVEPDAVAGAAAAPHAHVVVYDLEELARLRDPPGLYLGPDRHVVQGDLERPRADELEQIDKHLKLTLHFKGEGPTCVSTALQRKKVIMQA